MCSRGRERCVVHWGVSANRELLSEMEGSKAEVEIARNIDEVVNSP